MALQWWRGGSSRGLQNLKKAATLTVAGLGAALIMCVARPAGVSRGAGPSDPAADPWGAAQVVQPADLVKQLAGPADARPLVVCVGFNFLYQATHIPGAVFLGPARESAGLQRLKDAAQGWPRDREIVIYCGCCPFKQCPNVRPAFAVLKDMGFTKLHVLHIENDLRTDWLKPGYPVEKSLPATR